MLTCGKVVRRSKTFQNLWITDINKSIFSGNLGFWITQEFMR